MSLKDILTNEFTLLYDNKRQSLLIYTGLNPSLTDTPIEHRLSTLQDLGKDEAAKFVGQTILLLIPQVRSELFREASE